MSRETIAQSVKAYITAELLGDPTRVLRDDDPLLLDGLIDSLGAVRLVAFLESNWDVSVPPQDVTVENFGTVADIASYVGSRKEASDQA